MSNKTIIKSYREENVSIKITDFQLRDVSIYGCDATFDFNIYDKETMVLLDTDFETIENAFMGVDDSEDLWNLNSRRIHKNGWKACMVARQRLIPPYK